VLKQAGVVHGKLNHSKSIKAVVSLLCISFLVYGTLTKVLIEGVGDLMLCTTPVLSYYGPYTLL